MRECLLPESPDYAAASSGLRLRRSPAGLTMALTEDHLKAAEQRMSEVMRSTPRAVSAHYDRRVSRVVVSLDSGLELAFPPHMAEGLSEAKPADLARIEISPTGLGLHFPALDADLYLPALLEGVFGSPSWMAGLMGKRGGKSRSEIKQGAARRNGRLGGRPRRAAQR